MKALYLLSLLGVLNAQEAALSPAKPPAALSGQLLIQAVWAGTPGPKVKLVLPTTQQTFELQAQAGAIVATSVIPRSPKYELWVENPPHGPRHLPLEIPSQGQRFILILQGEHPASMGAWIIPGDLELFPWGSAALLNLSDQRLRCQLNDQAGEVDPGKAGVLPFVCAERATVHLTLDYQDKKTWLPDCSTKTILSPTRRFILVVGPGLAAQGPLPKATVIESDPAPLTVPPPLPHLPTK